MDDKLNRLAGEMLPTFAPFEYALKAAGFRRGEGTAEPTGVHSRSQFPTSSTNPTTALYEKPFAIPWIIPPKNRSSQTACLDASDSN
jgi:hypothetical protein